MHTLQIGDIVECIDSSFLTDFGVDVSYEYTVDDVNEEGNIRINSSNVYFASIRFRLKRRPISTSKGTLLEQGWYGLLLNGRQTTKFEYYNGMRDVLCAQVDGKWHYWKIDGTKFLDSRMPPPIEYIIPAEVVEKTKEIRQIQTLILESDPTQTSVQLRDGRKAGIYEVDQNRIFGWYIDHNDVKYAMSWPLGGHSPETSRDNDNFDLVNIPRVEQRIWWAALRNDRTVTHFSSRPSDNWLKSEGYIAIQQVPIEIKEKVWEY